MKWCIGTVDQPLCDYDFCRWNITCSHSIFAECFRGRNPNHTNLGVKAISVKPHILDFNASSIIRQRRCSRERSGMSSRIPRQQHIHDVHGDVLCRSQPLRMGIRWKCDCSSSAHGERADVCFHDDPQSEGTQSTG